MEMLSPTTHHKSATEEHMDLEQLREEDIGREDGDKDMIVGPDIAVADFDVQDVAQVVDIDWEVDKKSFVT